MGTAPQPLLAVITGRPGSGKTTLASELAPAIRLPLVSRDRLKEGLVRTMGPGLVSEAEASERVFHAFFGTVEALIDAGISLLAEAAFQGHVWSPRLESLAARADVRIVVCQTPPERAWERMMNRARQDPQWSSYHPLPEFHRGGEEPYDPPRLDVPTLAVDTAEAFRPGLAEIIAFLK